MNIEKNRYIRKKIAIISYGNCANLGDRIGQSIILGMIPFDCSSIFFICLHFGTMNLKTMIMI